MLFTIKYIDYYIKYLLVNESNLIKLNTNTIIVSLIAYLHEIIYFDIFSENI